MGMVNCRECKQEISSKAESCPHCGAKAKKKTSVFTWIVLLLIVGWAITNINEATHPSGVSSTASNSSSNSGGAASVVADAKPAPVWGTTTSKDEMSGEFQAFASSPSVGPQREMTFPYNDTNAWLGVGCDSTGDEWAYVGFSSAPNLVNDDTKDGYNLSTSRVKWDERLENMEFSQKWGSSFLHFVDDKEAIAEIQRSSSTMVEVDWHSQGKVIFLFSLKGSSAALAAIRAECAARKK